MTNTSSHTLWRYGVFNLVLLAMVAAWFWQQNKPVTLIQPQLATDGKLQCVSYAPYYGEGQTPFIKSTRISQLQIESDLKLLAQRSQCVRIYSVSQGLDYVPQAAEKIGLKVLLGAWIGWVSAQNELELNTAIKLANQFPQTVTGLVVGNEVMLRGEQTKQAMASYLHRAKAATKVPVTYADVWEYWIRYRSLESSVDFVTVHVLPYWEDTPQPVDNAMHHVNVVMDKLAQTFHKPIFIGETGWPSAGRHRNDSIPSTVNQAQYLREFLGRAHEAGWNYNLIEAVDQPWKRELEGAVGGYWGLYDTALQPKFSFTDRVAERQDGLKPVYYGLAGLLLSLMVSWGSGERRASALFTMATMGAAAGALALLQFQYMIIACRDSQEWLALGALNLTGTLLLLSIPALLASQHTQQTHHYYSGPMLRIGLFILVAGTAIAGLLLMPKAWVLAPLSKAAPSLAGFLYNMDGRYRDFPLSIYLMPVLQIAIGLRLANLRQFSISTFRYYRYLNIIALLTMAIFICSEPLNIQAYAWTGLVILLAIASWPRDKKDSSSNDDSIEKALYPI